jgi:hypothetical protein
MWSAIGSQSLEIAQPLRRDTATEGPAATYYAETLSRLSM